MARPLALFAKPPLLMTESAEDFAALSAVLEQEIKPRGAVERIYVADIAAHVWEILRLRRCKAGIVNTAFKEALGDLLNNLEGTTTWTTPERQQREALIRDWFSEPRAKKEVSQLLGKYQLDEFAIEAEAIRIRSEDLERLDTMLTSAESRRDRALRRIADDRDRFAKKVREGSDRVIEGQAVVQLENRSVLRSA